MAWTDDVAGLINSLANPRYATAEPPASAPILFDGILNMASPTGTGGGAVPTPVTFVAHPDDVHPYGVDVWNNAQAGLYGPIGPYDPFIPARATITKEPPPGTPPEIVALVKETQDILARLEKLEKNGSRSKKASP